MMGLAVAITGIPGGDLTATENATNLRVLRFSSDSSLGTLYTRYPNPNRSGNFSHGFRSCDEPWLHCSSER